MSPKLYCAIPNSYVVNGATGLKGKYVKIISVNDWNGSIINVKVSNYGNGSYFYIILCLATNNISRWASGKLIAGNISGFSFYRVDKSIYMFIPDSIQDLYVTLDASMGNVSYGEEYENTIDLSNPITISWHNSLSTLDLGELLGNPKGTKSFSSWSEFTDFVNEMPIKTIQPFVSNFNAFAGEGFYGNVVQGLVIKQLEDAVFIFGIAIDGTLIFRKRNYPDVSTWEDPKIIIHSNNWHKIYFVTDLGGLLENRLVKYKEMNLGANEIIDTGANTGLIHFKINTTSASCVFFCNSGSSNIMLITQNIDNYFTTNKSSNSGKIAIYKESDNGNILIKNLTAINYGTFVFYYI